MIEPHSQTSQKRTFQTLKRLTKTLDANSKFGLYLSNGNNTCQGRAGSWGYEDQDAQYLARLKVDYLKCKSRQTASESLSFSDIGPVCCPQTTTAA